jgi:hypothetical protein
MNALSNTDSVSETLASPRLRRLTPATIDSAKRITRAMDSTGLRTLNRYTSAVLQGVGCVLAALYFVGAAAIAVAMLYHTFVR